MALAIYIRKMDLKAKERRIMGTQIFHHAKIQSSKKKSSKRNPKKKSFKILEL
jgi:hypothetical protein